MAVPLALPAAASAGPPGWAVAAGLGLLSLGKNIFGSNREEAERQRRRSQLLARIRQLRTEDVARAEKTIREGRQQLSSTISGQTAEARQAAARRAIAMGRMGDIESFALPIEQSIASRGSQATGQYELQSQRALDELNRQYNQAELSAEEGFTDRPIQPSFADQLFESGVQAYNVLNAQKAIESEEKFNEGYLDVLKRQLDLRKAPAIENLSPSIRSFDATVPELYQPPVLMPALRRYTPEMFRP